jgi:hypoxia up-regulated 1
VIALVEKAETWLAEKLAAQEKVAGSEPPAFTAAEVSASLKPTANLVTKLSRKPAPKPAIVLNSTKATDAGNATAAPGNATADAGNSTTTTAAPASKDAKSAEGDAEKKDTAAGDDEL